MPRRRSWPASARRLLCDVVTLGRFALTSRALLAAENLFLRKQLALYQERRVRSRRPDPATRVILVLLSGLALAPDGGPAGHLIRWHSSITAVLNWRASLDSPQIEREK